MSIGNVASSALCLNLSLAAILAVPGVAGGRALPAASILQHELTVELRPASHELIVQDHIDLTRPGGATQVAFTLASSLQVDSILLEPASPDQPGQGEPVVTFRTEPLDHSSAQRILLDLPPGADRLRLTWTYRGVMNDPPKEPRHLRFVTPSETAGHVGPEGVYLSSESHWYPDIDGSLSRFQVSAHVPRDWTVVTQGRKIRDTIEGGLAVSSWTVGDPSEALTLVANRFVSQRRGWTGPNGQQVELATYFFEDNAGLADEYLNATVKYLDAYVPLLGEYPFEKFAVVENFFASGLGMPSFTLLGSGSIKRHYVQPYALGHEIVHSWIGNSVFNRADRGNWVEGLTTYLANYYWHELAQDEAQAREQRRLMVQAYSLYVAPAQDYPVAQFTRKRDEADNAIGYQKAAAVFHLLRLEIGDDLFWKGLKTLVERFRTRQADWGSLEQVFAEVSGRDLRWFFFQWAEQGGAPVLALDQASAVPVSDVDPSGKWRLTVGIQQQQRQPFRIKLPLAITTRDGSRTHWISVRQPETKVEIVLSQQPLLVRLDPDFMVFRRMGRGELPPMLNGFVTDAERIVVKAFGGSQSPLDQIARRLAEQEQPSATRRTVILTHSDPLPPTGSLLLLADSDQRPFAQSLIAESCGDRISLHEEGVRIGDRRHDGPTIAVLVSCPRAKAPGSVLSVLYGVTPSSVAKVSRLLFYYGWHSVVVFRDGAVAAREVWEYEQETKEVQFHVDR